MPKIRYKTGKWGRTNLAEEYLNVICKIALRPDKKEQTCNEEGKTAEYGRQIVNTKHTVSQYSPSAALYSGRYGVEIEHKRILPGYKRDRVENGRKPDQESYQNRGKLIKVAVFYV